jgi:hypothetical protein
LKRQIGKFLHLRFRIREINSLLELDSSSSITEDSRYFNSPKMILPITMEKLSFFVKTLMICSVTMLPSGLPILLKGLFMELSLSPCILEDNSKTILNLDKLNSYDIVTLEFDVIWFFVP